MTNKITLDEENLEKLNHFKNVFEIVLEEEFEFNDYVNIVLSIGIDKMLRDAIPEGQEWNTIKIAFDQKFDFMCDLIADIWKKGAEVGEEDKSSVKERMDRYIK